MTFKFATFEAKRACNITIESAQSAFQSLEKMAVAESRTALDRLRVGLNVTQEAQLPQR